jgi:uncharacterized iron-regulated membrane protein
MTEEAPDGGTATAGRLYRIIWRWHFYAGLICLPVFILLATTGAIYLFRDELSLVLEKKLLVAESPRAAPLAPEALVARAVAAVPGQAVRFEPPPGPGRSVQVGVMDGAEQITDVFLNPADGRVLGTVPHDRRLMTTVSNIHSLILFGAGPNRIVEVVAGWAMLLVASGLFLWWPRGRKGGVVTVRGSPSRRLWWRDLHAVTGLFTAAVLLFLAVTGMPWTGFWGERMGRLADRAGLGMPAAVSPAGQASEALGTITPGSWTMDRSAAPGSTAAGPAPLSLSAVMARARELGLPAGYVVRLPLDPTGVFTLQVAPKAATGQRVVHLDQYSGKVLADVGFADYGPVSKAVEWAIAVHMGGQYGRANQLILLAGCIGVVTLCVTGATMWWKRRPRGRLAAPPAPSPGAVSAFAGLALALGLLFPLLGLSILAVLALDRLAPAALKLKYEL